MVKDLCVYQKYRFSKGASNQPSQDSRHRLNIDDFERPYFSKINNLNLKR